jgi:polar amino acid transport system substrate-binding protein
MIAAAVTDTKARQEKYDFVDYFNAGQAIVVPAGNPEGITAVEDLCGKSVSVLVSSAQEALLNQFNTDECASDAIAITSLPNDQDALLQVQSGRADASFTQEPVGRYNAAQIAGGNAFEVANSEPLYANPLGYVFRKDSTELRDAVQAALQSLIDDGTYGEILEARELGSGAVEAATVNAGTQ